MVLAFLLGHSAFCKRYQARRQCDPVRPDTFAFRGHRTQRRCRIFVPQCNTDSNPSKTHETNYLPKRPYGYYTDIQNVIQDLHIYLRRSKKSMTYLPTAADLVADGEKGLSGAMRRHTWARISELSGLRLCSHARPRSLHLATYSNFLQARPHNYWQKWENVRAELSAVIRRIGYMPTAKELERMGRSDLKRAIAKHGGLRAVARKLGVQERTMARTDWTMEVVVKEMWSVMNMVDEGLKWPEDEHIKLFGRRGLRSAIKRLGGKKVVAKSMGIKARGKRFEVKRKAVKRKETQNMRSY